MTTPDWISMFATLSTLLLVVTSVYRERVRRKQDMALVESFRELEKTLLSQAADENKTTFSRTFDAGGSAAFAAAADLAAHMLLKERMRRAIPKDMN